ncbi:MAG: flagellum-specific ATP synthase FliI, partial [Alphaproteobacteria bacterium]
ELIRIGAYREGSNPEVDEAIRLYPDLEAFLGQDKDESCSLEDGYAQLGQILGMPASDDGAGTDPQPADAGPEPATEPR